MPQQTSVVITANNDGTYTLQIGPNGFSGQQSDLFTQQFNSTQLASNIRLALLIGNYSQLNSAEYLNAVNRNGGGIQLQDQRYFISSIVPTGDGNTYTVGFSLTREGPVVQTVQVVLTDVLSDIQDLTVILPNLASFLRLNGYTSLSPAAVAAINAAQFWF